MISARKARKESAGPDRENTARHEAGHFVASSVLLPHSYRFRVTIVPDEEENAAGYFHGEGDEEEVDDMRAQVVMLFAGLAAERRFNQDADIRHSGSDTEQARMVLARLGEEDAEGEYRARTDKFVEEHWPEVEAIAQELLKCGTLEWDEGDIVMEIARGERGVGWEDLQRLRQLKNPRP